MRKMRQQDLVRDLASRNKTVIELKIQLTDLGWSKALLAKFENLFLNIVSSEFQPGWDAATVGQRRLGNTLAENIKNTLLSNAMWWSRSVHRL